MIDKTKYIQKLIWFDRVLARRIVRAAKQADTDAAKWIRQACREKLERDALTWHDSTAAAQAAQEK